MCGPENIAAVGALTECHRGIFDIEEPLPGYQHQPTLSCDPLGGRLWTISDGTYRTVFCEGDTGLVAFDTFYSPGAAVAYRKALNRVFPGKPIHTVVYSHDHLDHAGFADDLAPGADVIAHAECAAVVAARRADGQTLPTETFEEPAVTYEIDGVHFELLYPGPTHGNGNVAALFPRERALFMVDTVIPGVGYTFFPDWHVAGYVRTMREMLSRSDGWDSFVPGHFWLVDREGAEANLTYVEAVEEVARVALLEGVDPDDLAACTAAASTHLGPTYGSLFRFREYAGMNLMRMMALLRQGGWGLEDARRDAATAAAEREAPLPLELGAALDRRRDPAAGAGPPPRALEHEIENGVVAVGRDDRYALLAATPEGPLCVGTLGTPAAAAELAGEARALGGQPLLVLATDHADQSGFAAELGARRILAHELSARALAGKLGDWAPGPLELVWADGADLDLGGVEVGLRYPGPTVGTGTLAVHLPGPDVLYVVGPRPDARYGLIPDVHLAGATARWRSLLSLRPKTVVFARGGVGTPEQLSRACDYLDGLAYVAQQAYADGLAVWSLEAMEEFAVELLRNDFGDLAGFDDHVGIGAIRVVHHFLMGGWGLEDSDPGLPTRD